MEFFKKLANFIKSVAKDDRIPERDKKLIAVFLVLIVSPIDLIPDWIPIIGVLDDIFILALVLDYFFEVLDDDLLLSHYPWGMKSFSFIKRSSRLISQLTPKFLKDKIWKYKPDPY